MRGPLATIVLTHFAIAAASYAAEPIAASALSFFEGVWVGQEDGVESEEHWTSPSGNGLLGMHKDVKDGRMVSFEFFRIAPDENGVLAYFASPGGAPATLFSLKSLEGGRAIFEDPEHDFPQRVIYWLEPDGRLAARIEGMVGGNLESMEWRWTKRP